MFKTILVPLLIAWFLTNGLAADASWDIEDAYFFQRELKTLNDVFEFNSGHATVARVTASLCKTVAPAPTTAAPMTTTTTKASSTKPSTSAKPPEQKREKVRKAVRQKAGEILIIGPCNGTSFEDNYRLVDAVALTSAGRSLVVTVGSEPVWKSVSEANVNFETAHILHFNSLTADDKLPTAPFKPAGVGTGNTFVGYVESPEGGGYANGSLEALIASYETTLNKYILVNVERLVATPMPYTLPAGLKIVFYQPLKHDLSPQDTDKLCSHYREWVHVDEAILYYDISDVLRDKVAPPFTDSPLTTTDINGSGNLQSLVSVVLFTVVVSRSMWPR